MDDGSGLIATGRTEWLVGVAARRLATTTTRRSFIGLVARAALALAGTPAILWLSAEDALALQCDCAGRACDSGCGSGRSCSCQECGHSVTCKGLTGSGCPSTGGTGGQCPSGTYACGSWTCSCSLPGCPNGLRTWTDCCDGAGRCSDPSSARCVCDVDGVRRPTCTYRRCYGSGACNFIRCRFANC